MDEHLRLNMQAEIAADRRLAMRDPDDVAAEAEEAEQHRLMAAFRQNPPDEIDRYLRGLFTAIGPSYTPAEAIDAAARLREDLGL